MKHLLDMYGKNLAGINLFFFYDCQIHQYFPPAKISRYTVLKHKTTYKITMAYLWPCSHSSISPILISARELVNFTWRLKWPSYVAWPDYSMCRIIILGLHTLYIVNINNNIGFINKYISTVCCQVCCQVLQKSFVQLVASRKSEKWSVMAYHNFIDKWLFQ